MSKSYYFKIMSTTKNPVKQILGNQSLDPKPLYEN